eukprot:TRINITY_DN345_c0_g1_i1.p1 TRINITY_DN345_c0_g1~~TRINITY_DN345_c0_g1_i1.p1  ORF type:complete len:145 (+),score=27.59 TRINITY_DN345_c0_g1_i1:214-648(+)
MSELKKYTKAEVAEHKSFKDGKKDVWCIFEGKVYDISSFIEDHPGGEEVLLDRAGDDMTQQFADIGHSDYARQLMKGMLLGELVRPRITRAQVVSFSLLFYLETFVPIVAYSQTAWSAAATPLVVFLVFQFPVSRDGPWVDPPG